ncbi:sugar ABC transporter permease [Blautia wexlerae]|uniref:carbohydrate ABC transporter permease n=1 Tax=Blautia wexlerae TaxID=418240 RepID=UPI001570FA73|nr:sugar ABC transporter permease [Blautia wexlerae]NSF38962.1 sugar ABC transporter permease [Blautia wexlerae]NSK15659.1 sugar ABC transporter permease [Blautia wexlerae]
MNKLGKKNNWAAYLFILPLILLSFVMIYYCIIRTVMTSFTDWNGMSDTMNFVGLKNYAKLVKDKTFWTAVVNNIIFFFGTVFVQAGVGFLIAVLLKKKLPGSNMFKAVYFMPIAMATSITTAIFKIIMDPTNGSLNNFLRAIHLDMFAVSWLGDKRYALLSVIIVNIFQWMGFSMITYYAGLMALPDDVYEAAKIDGAGFWRTTVSVTFPMLKGTTNVLLILGIVGSLKTFDIVKLLTDGGPGRSTTVLNTYLYEKAFKDFNAGGAAAIGVAILIIAMIMSFLQIKLGKED